MPLDVHQPQHLSEPPNFGRGRQVKVTRSICPQCLDPIDAQVVERDGEIWMDKACAEHGRYSALLSSDARHYYLADPRVEALGSCCGPSGCGPRHSGDQVANHSCNMLIEITQRCNLTCPTCYADSSPQREESMTMAQFEALLGDLLRKGKGDADLIQISGGEPTIHPKIFEMIEHALHRGVRQVYVNTNGIKLAQPEFAQRLAGLGPKVSVYLQFDGMKRRALEVLRGRGNLLETKQRALANCEAFGINTVPVMTLTPGVNDDQLGDLLALAHSHPKAVRKVMIQPAMYSGRYDNPRRVRRMTLADVAEHIAEQSGGTFIGDDFSPIPCSDPNCFSMALALRTDDGFLPVSRYFPKYDQWAEARNRDLITSITDTFDSVDDMQQAMKWAFSSGALAALDEASLDALLDRVAQWQAAKAAGDGWKGLFAIGVKPFMDAYTYDQDRIDKCCVHVIARDGTPVSFCEYNAVRRPRGEL